MLSDLTLADVLRLFWIPLVSFVFYFVKEDRAKIKDHEDKIHQLEKNMITEDETKKILREHNLPVMDEISYLRSKLDSMEGAIYEIRTFMAVSEERYQQQQKRDP